MDPVLQAALRAGEKRAHLVTVTLPGHTIRWVMEGGFVVFGGQTYRDVDPVYGRLIKIGEIVDGVTDDASPTEIEIQFPSLAALADLTAVDAQGGLATIHLCCVSAATGLLIGAPYRLHIGSLDRPVRNVRDRTLAYDIITAEALGLEANEEQRQSDAFHQDIWPGEAGYRYQTDGTKLVFWREDDPNNAIGFISPKPKKGGDPEEFTYETDAGWPFPFGRTNVRGVINGRFGFGPTNRYNVIFATVAASGPINAFVEFHANDELTHFGAGDIALDGTHDGAMWLQTRVGDQPQAALTTPAGVAFEPSEWTSANGMSGKACFALTMFENSKGNEFNHGVPTVQNVVEGLKGYDPRVSGCDPAAPSTWPYIETGPAAALSWAMGRWEGPEAGGHEAGAPYVTRIVGGLGAALDEIDVDAHADAATMADTYGWKVSCVPTSADDKHQVRKDLLASAGCEPATICGRISLVCNARVVASLMTVTNADTAGDFTVAMRASRLERRNVTMPKFKSEPHRWEMTQLRALGNPDWQTEDGRRRATGPSFPTVPDKDQCAALGYLDLAHDRAPYGETPFNAWLMAVEPGQGFTWDEPEYLLEGVKVQVRKRAYDPMKTSVKVNWRQERDADYTEALAQVGVAPPPSDDYVPPPTYVEPPTMLAGEPDSGTVHLRYRNPTADVDFAYVQIWRALGSTNFADAMSIGGFFTGGLGETMTVDDVIGIGGTYTYWAVASHGPGADSTPEGPVTVVLP